MIYFNNQLFFYPLRGFKMSGGKEMDAGTVGGKCRRGVKSYA